MRFSIYNCFYPALENNMKETGLFEIKNFWDKVLDFNWHKQDKSPNWDTVDPKQQRTVIG
jgi:hypothetical protein